MTGVGREALLPGGEGVGLAARVQRAGDPVEPARPREGRGGRRHRAHRRHGGRAGFHIRFKPCSAQFERRFLFCP